MYSDLDDAFSAFGSVSTDTWIKSDKYTDYPIYHDEQYAYIEGRTIGDINSQISVQGESYSQYISFMMDRYYDGVDITTKSIWIHYELADGSGSESSPINVYYNDSNVRFGWIIPDQATQQAGDIKIGVWVTGTAPNTKNYLLKTETKIYTIKNGLVPGSGITQPDQNWFEQFVSQMDNKVSTAQGYANDAQASKTAAAGSATAAAQSADASAQALQENKDYVESQKETFVGYNKRETDLKYANALIGSASGTGRVTVGDAWEAPIPDLEVAGKSEQVSTTGAQLLQDSNIYPGFLTNANGTRTNDNNYRTVWLSLPAGTYTLSVPGGVMIVKTVIDGILNNSSTSIADGAGYTCTLTQDGFLGISFRKQDSSDYTTEPQVMLNTGSTAKPWEPYTGGKPSPSPDYPQPIISTGTVGTGAQLFDASKVLNKSLGGAAIVNNADGSVTISGSGAMTDTLDTRTTLTHEETMELIGNERTFTITANVRSHPYFFFNFIDKNGVVLRRELSNNTTCITGTIPTTVDIDTLYIQFGYYGRVGTSIVSGTQKVMVNAGSTALPWESYTGGKPSPSEEYPQPLDVTVTGANLFDASLLKSMAGGTWSLSDGERKISVTGINPYAACTAAVPIDSIRGKTVTLSGNIESRTNVDCPVAIQGRLTLSDGRLEYYAATYKKMAITIPEDAQSFKIELITNNRNTALDIANTTVFTDVLLSFDGEATWELFAGYQTATIQLTAPLYGIGDVRDRIMCKGGEWGIERQFIALTFDGSEDEGWGNMTTNTSEKMRLTPNGIFGLKPTNNLIASPGLSNLFGAFIPAGNAGTFGTKQGVSIDHKGGLVLYCEKYNTVNSLSAWKEFLQSNNLLVVALLDTPTWEPLPSATQSALNALTTFTGTTHITITAGGPEPDVAVEYVQDTNVIIAGLKKLIEGLINA